MLDFLNVLLTTPATQQQDVDESPCHAMDGESWAVAVVIQTLARTFRKCYIRNSEQMTTYIFVQYDKQKKRRQNMPTLFTTHSKNNDYKFFDQYFRSTEM